MDDGYQFVKYRPWVGNRYERGSILGQKVLIVAESHYWWPTCIDDANLTDRVVREWAEVAERRPTFSDKIASAVLGEDNLDDHRYCTFWQSVAYCNYVRHLMPAASRRPSHEMFAEKEAFFALQEVLSNVNPKLVVMCSQRVWNYLPNFDRPDDDGTSYVGRDVGWYTTIQDQEALLLGLPHPRNWNFRRQTSMHWHPYIRRAMEYCASTPAR